MMGLYYMSVCSYYNPDMESILKILLQAGIYPNVLDRDGSNILHKMDHNYLLDIHQIICKIGNRSKYAKYIWI